VSSLCSALAPQYVSPATAVMLSPAQLMLCTCSMHAQLQLRTCGMRIQHMLCTCTCTPPDDAEPQQAVLCCCPVPAPAHGCHRPCSRLVCRLDTAQHVVQQLQQHTAQGINTCCDGCMVPECPPCRLHWILLLWLSPGYHTCHSVQALYATLCARTPT
jgi:hypothetical protein